MLDELERRVDERTSELSEANKLLKSEISERKKIESALRKGERELRDKSANLERVNTALTVLLKRREDDRVELEEKVLSNVKQLVIPYIERLKTTRLNSGQSDYVNILESHLKDVVSPFLHNVKSKYFDLTPKEIEIANLVKEGKTTKHIAELLGCSQQAVDFHRFNIRNKLGMRHKKANLRSHLLSLS
jgi:DNA-binding CsgD family transcriptional regulator